MDEDKEVRLKGKSEGRARVEGNLTVTPFGQYFARRRVGISPDLAKELQDDVKTWMNRAEDMGQDLSETEAWSLVASVEQWRQARWAFFAAVAIGVIAIVVAICSLLVAICSLEVSMYQLRILGGKTSREIHGEEPLPPPGTREPL